MSQVNKENRIVVNRIQCDYCKDIITSDFRHDFKSCSCYRVSVDGGQAYLRRSCEEGHTYTEMSLFEDSDFREIRKYHKRGSMGKDSLGPMKWVALYDIGDDYLDNLIDFMNKYGYEETVQAKMYRMERDYRNRQFTDCLLGEFYD